LSKGGNISPPFEKGRWGGILECDFKKLNSYDVFLDMTEIEKPIKFSQHALDNMFERGASREEAEQAIRTGERLPAQKGRIAFRKNFSHNGMWKGKFYQAKQVMPIVAEEPERFVVITVYVFFIGGAR